MFFEISQIQRVSGLSKIYKNPQRYSRVVDFPHGSVVTQGKESGGKLFVAENRENIIGSMCVN